MVHLVRKLIDAAAGSGLPIAAVAAFALLDAAWPGYVLAALALAYGWYRYRADGLGRARVARALIPASVLIGLGPHIGVAQAISGVLLVALVSFEPRLALALSTRRLATANLPVDRAAWERWVNPRNAYLLIAALNALFLASSALAWGATAVAAACGAVTVACGAGVVAQWRIRRRRAHSGDDEVRAAVAAHRPRFAVHFAAPPGSEYQLRLWLPYFDRIGDNYVIVLRDKQFLAAFADATDAPIVMAPSITAMEGLLVDSIGAVFYVNNSMHNSQCVRFAHLTHIQLMHGDSDKPASYNPISAMYDRIFVAGQAGIDRYHNHGIDIPASRFRVVGHPQVAAVDVGERAGATETVALYAPTWTGLSSDANFCSLPIARDVCAALIDRGVTVIVRPHPYTRRNPAAARQLDAVERLLAADAERSGRKHLWGKTTSQQMSLVDCINAADVMVTDASGAASDWLYSEKPFAVTDMTGLNDELFEALPLARAAYVIRRDAGNIDAVCTELLDTDPLAADRVKMKTYYLGDFSADSYEEAFFAAARECYRT
ncbi:MAG TPA: CDP-glycerol glycerophosphotransferase family protein [Stackebrandtia sp.]|uniref:CDP-glycerol glycerophosphotransferase family protein n=1 Tax=Stackebrandtia sp. TaxID=2023065 RepID=UPI002D544844|nr:CDP-glycerol glycerophosphotransferase family protein [Stackebrandtia sp.]HZE37630.1 CDP-glycerol glycerophosphotransferase family protein [Stackebrandtia sp.]